jgi:inorganic triphosphatase YgiF
MTDEWQKEISDQIKRLKYALGVLRVTKKRVPDPEKQTMASVTGKVEEALKAIDKDKSKGVHNFLYAKKLMSQAEKEVLATQKPFSKGVQ